MKSITDLWRKDEEMFNEKTFKQILAFTGEGELI